MSTNELNTNKLDNEEKINKKREALLKITEQISDLNGEKKLTIERKKYETSNDVINENLIKLKENELTLNKNITIAEREVLDIEASVANEREKIEEVKNKLNSRSFYVNTSGKISFSLATDTVDYLVQNVTGEPIGEFD